MVPYDKIVTMLHSAGLFRQTILEIVSPAPDSAIEESIVYLDRLKWHPGSSMEREA
jgi:hypothetical protein